MKMDLEAERKKINYAVACVSEFAKRRGITQKRAFEILDHRGGLEFLKAHYEIEHTLSLEEAIDDLEKICERNG